MPSVAVRKSPTEQILEETIRKVESDDDFDEDVVSNLMKLIPKNSFTKSQKILEILKKEVTANTTT